MRNQDSDLALQGGDVADGFIQSSLKSFMSLSTIGFQGREYVKAATGKFAKPLKNLQITVMLTNQKATPRLGFFDGLRDQLDQKNPLYLLAGSIDRSLFEDNFKSPAAKKGASLPSPSGSW